MAIAQLTSIRKTDGSIRRVFRVFDGEDRVTAVLPEEGETIVYTAQASTLLAKMMGATENPSHEELEAEMLVIAQLYENDEFEDISNTIDDPSS
ncbi:MAG: hypothetical protein ABL917_01445 [Parcubacteria group bacterium]